MSFLRLVGMNNRICTAVQYFGTTNVTLSWLVSWGSMAMSRPFLVILCWRFHGKSEFPYSVLALPPSSLKYSSVFCSIASDRVDCYAAAFPFQLSHPGEVLRTVSTVSRLLQFGHRLGCRACYSLRDFTLINGREKLLNFTIASIPVAATLMPSQGR